MSVMYCVRKERVGSRPSVRRVSRKQKVSHWTGFLPKALFLGATCQRVEVYHELRLPKFKSIDGQPCVFHYVRSALLQGAQRRIR